MLTAAFATTNKGTNMATAHQGLDITDTECAAFGEQLVPTLDELKAQAREKKELLHLFGPMRTDIVVR